MTRLVSLNRWLTVLHPKPNARLRLFIFPYAGAGPAVFREWPQHLPSDVEALVLQLPGRGSRFDESPYTRLAPLVEDMAAGIRAYLEAPLVFFGHSMGAVLAFELARYLRGRSISPLQLHVSAYPTPRLSNQRPPIHGLPDGEFVEEIRSLKGTPEEVLESEELLELFLPLLKADFELVETYRYRGAEPLDLPIFAYGGDADAWTDPQDIHAWREETKVSFAAEIFPGDHFYLNARASALLASVSGHLSELPYG